LVTLLDRRTALRFGAFAAAMVFVPLAGLALFIAGLAECTHCGVPSFIADAWLLSALLAASFGLVSGVAAAWVKPLLDRKIHPQIAFVAVVLTIVIAASAVVWSAPHMYAYAQYIRTPRDQLAPGDPNRINSDCQKRKLPQNAICAY
jgi:hypothetical protein